MKYSFSMAVPSPHTISHSDALKNAKKLVEDAGGYLGEGSMPWSTRDGRPAVLVFVEGTTDGVQEVLAGWLDNDVIYEYHITKARQP